MKEVKGLIFDIQRFSLHDGPGIRSTVFLKGCPLSCLWCHNPESLDPRREVFYDKDSCINCLECLSSCGKEALSISGDVLHFDKAKCDACGDCTHICPTDALVMIGREMAATDVASIIMRDKVFYDTSKGGVTISGGEPMMQANFVAALVQELRQMDISVALDTCGYAPFSDYEKILAYVDIILFDLKSVDDVKHMEFTKRSNRLIKDNFKRLINLGRRVFVRVPLIPGFNDDADSIKELSAFIKSCGTPEEVDILPFNMLAKQKYLKFGIDYRFNRHEQVSQNRIEEAARIFTNDGFKVSVYS
jgi:pyruvate formate lyase activating enzyme